MIGLERRTLPGDSGASVEAELRSLLDSCRAGDPELEAEHRILLVRQPFEESSDSEVVLAVREAASPKKAALSADYSQVLPRVAWCRRPPSPTAVGVQALVATSA